eukprot:CAMPEP_0171942722 /NCGR_PEP_ID=MMETSP0993-20121228/38901_1 /TAXON_ID=483369 /ORGANISM="non described non described, Strain CCMP2098" /LENGTH=59 /DNA_ID=CAMNT_0012585201 /DNA_START=1 /DNA_END=176 /DNA_ORIENTATION=+
MPQGMPQGSGGEHGHGHPNPLHRHHRPNGLPGGRKKGSNNNRMLIVLHHSLEYSAKKAT